MLPRQQLKLASFLFGVIMPKWGSNPPQTFICKYCDSPFERVVSPSRATFDFCSPTCRNKARALDKIPCPICGKLFIPRINDTTPNGTIRKRHCSSKCARASLLGRKSPKRTPDYIVELVKQRYPSEGASLLAKELDKTERAINIIASRNGVKCDKTNQYEATRQRMKENNPMKNPTVAQKVSDFWKNNPEKVQEIISKANESRSKIMRDKPSKPEFAMCSILDNLGIQYQHQFTVKKGFVVDFKIDNTILQVDGEYWHGHPRFEPLSERQLKQQKRDKAQDAYLITCGYVVLRVWESDVNHDYVSCLLQHLL